MTTGVRIENFLIKEAIQKDRKIGVWQVRQIDKDERGSWLREEFTYPINNAAKKEEAWDKAVEYAKKAKPYD